MTDFQGWCTRIGPDGSELSFSGSLQLAYVVFGFRALARSVNRVKGELE